MKDHTWEIDPIADTDQLCAAIAKTMSAFGIDAVTLRISEEDFDYDDEQFDQRITVESFDDFDDVMFDVHTPCELRGSWTFRGSGLELSTGRIASDFDRMYLAFVRIAVELGARPEALIDEDDGDSFLEDVRGMVEACIEDFGANENLELAVEMTLTTSPGSVGPLDLALSRTDGGILVRVLGAGRDVEIELPGFDGLSTAQLAIFEASLLDGLADIIHRERIVWIGKQAPDREPQFGGKLVCHTWEEGRRVRSEVIDPDWTFHETQQEHPHVDVIQYLGDGTPIARWSTVSIPNGAPLDRGWVTWRWIPTAGEIQAVWSRLAK